MEPIELQDWDAVIIRDTPRYRFKKRIVKESEVPEDIRGLLEANAREKKAQREQHIAEKLQEEAGVVSDEAVDQVIETTTIEVKDGISLQEKPLPPTAPEINHPSHPAVQAVESIYDASLEMLATALYERFGVYTSFIGEYPKPEDIHPFTGEYMTMYETGLARQMHTRFQAGMKASQDYEAKKAGALMSREMSKEAQNHVQRELTEQENREQNSFDYRTTQENVQSSAATMRRGDGQYGIDKDEVITDEYGRNVSIRPHW